MKAYLVLENGIVFEGLGFGALGEVTGEVVFTTGMTGYLETLTDPSYCGQIVLQTFPLIGNYGIIPADFERETIGILAYIVKYPCQDPSNFRSEGSLDIFLREKGIVGICGIDTRALTKIIRENGVMNGKITTHYPTKDDIEQARAYSVNAPVSKVSPKKTVTKGGGKRSIAMLDFGAKKSIAEALIQRDCKVTLLPYNTPADEILALSPDGIMLSNGPGDPADPANFVIVENLRKLIAAKIPIFGICLGHQLLAAAYGYKTQKLKFGHRGANQPVKDTATGQVYITSQNHGYTVVADNAWFINVNDGSCEGLDYGRSFSVQFHPEARGGPLDTAFLFDLFIERIEKYA